MLDGGDDGSIATGGGLPIGGGLEAGAGDSDSEDGIVVFDSRDGEIVLGPIDVGNAAGPSIVVGLTVIVGNFVLGDCDCWSLENAGGKSSLGSAIGRSSEKAGGRSLLNAGGLKKSSSGVPMGSHGLDTG